MGGGWSCQQGLPGHPAPPSHFSLRVQVHSYESPRAPATQAADAGLTFPSERDILESKSQQAFKHLCAPWASTPSQELCIPQNGGGPGW